MKKLIFGLITLVILTITLLAQKISDEKISDTYILTGSIDEKYKITMYLTISTDGKAEGKYYYHSSKKYIDISGKIKKNNLTLEEKIYNQKTYKYEITGEFVGIFNKNNITFEGDWINANGKKSMPFNITSNSSIAVKNVMKHQVVYDRIDFFSYDYITLLVNNSSINNSNSEFFKSISDEKEWYSEILNDWIENFNNISKEDRQYYYLNNFIDFVYSDNNIIVFSHYFRVSPPSASVDFHLSYSTYNIKTGKYLDNSASNLFINPQAQQLTSLLKKNFLVQGYSRDDFMDFDNLRLNDNFYIDIEGVHFVYNHGDEYLAIAGEQPEVSFTFEEIRPFIKKSSSFYYLFEAS